MFSALGVATGRAFNGKLGVRELFTTVAISIKAWIKVIRNGAFRFIHDPQGGNASDIFPHFPDVVFDEVPYVTYGAMGDGFENFNILREVNRGAKRFLHCYNIITVGESRRWVITCVVKCQGVPPGMNKAFGTFIGPKGTITNGVKGRAVAYPRGLSEEVRFLAWYDRVVTFKIQPTFVVLHEARSGQDCVQLYLCGHLVGVIRWFDLLLEVNAFTQSIVGRRHGKASARLVRLLGF